MPNLLKKRSFGVLAAFISLGSVAWGAEPPASPGTAFGPAPGVLLLKNSQVMEGQVEFSVDHYIVRMPDGEMQIRASEVEFFCRDLEDGYRHKKSVVQPGSIEERLKLAQWCVQHGMLAHASEEVAAAKKIDANNPGIKDWERIIKVEAEAKKETAPQTKSNIKLPSDEELEQMIRGMPPGAVQQYVSVVQPILLNLCPGAAGSTPGLSPSGRLQLLRPPFGETPNRRITQRNLYAVLQFVNWDSPGASALLTGIITPDSGTPVLVRHSVQYRRVEEWVYEMTQKPMPSGNEPSVAGASELPSIPELAQPIARPQRGRVHNAPRTVRSIADADVDENDEDGDGPTAPRSVGFQPMREKQHGQDAHATPPAAARPANAARPATAARPAGKGAQGQAKSSSDPFDPAEFNKQTPGDNGARPNALPTPAAQMLGNRQ